MNLIFVMILGIISTILIASFKFQYLASLFSIRLKFFQALNITIVSTIINYLVPFKTVPLIGKPLLIRSLTHSKLINSVLLSYSEFFIELLWQFLLIIPLILLLGTNYFGNNLIFNLILLLGIFVIGLILIRDLPFLLNFFLRKPWVLKLIPSKLHKKVKSHDFRKSFQFIIDRLYNWKFLLAILAISSLNIIIAPIILQSSAGIFGVYLSYSTFFIIYWVSSIIGRVSMIPAGLGSREAVIVGLLYFYGVDTIVALKIATFSRIIVLACALLFSSPFFVYTIKKVGFQYFGRKKLKTVNL